MAPGMFSRVGRAARLFLFGGLAAGVLSVVGLGVPGSARAQSLIETDWTPDPEAPYRLPDHAAPEALTGAGAEALRGRFEEIVEEHSLEGASWVIMTATGDELREVFSAGEPGERAAQLGEVTSMLVGLAALTLVGDNTLDLDARLNTYRPELADEIPHLGRAPTARELLIGLGGARVVGASAFDRPLTGGEIRGLLESRPNRRVAPTMAGPAIVLWLMGELEDKPARSALEDRLSGLGFDGLEVPAFGQLSASPQTIARGLATLVSDEPAIDPKTIGIAGEVGVGTFDQGLGFTLERIDADRGWVWRSADERARLSVRVDFERKTVSVLHLPGAEGFGDLAEELTARFELLVPSIRELETSPARFKPRLNARRRLATLDQDGDGRVAIDEVEPLTQATYRTLDQDANGYITINELAASAGAPGYR